MGIHNLDRILRPQSIAVIGARQNPDTAGAMMMHNLKEGGFGGEIFPVHPHHSQIMGYKAFSSIDAIVSPVDLGIITTDITEAPDIVEACGAAGMAGVIIVSAGGKETGSRGQEIEAAIRRKAEPYGLRVIGPNCIGIINARSFLNASMFHRMPIPGKTAFISQSGAICSSILDLSIRDHIGFSHVISLGSMLDVDFGDVIDYLGSDPFISSIVMYVENLTRIRNFMSATRAVSRVKPIIALKAGRTVSGSIAAASHTGADSGDDAIYDAAFKRAGIVRVKTFEELFDCSELLAKQSPPAGTALAIITNAGGPGVMAVDMLQDYGKSPAELSPETLQKLDAVLPTYWSRSNPVDIMGDAGPDRYLKAVDICLNAPEVSGVLVLFSPLAMQDPGTIAESLGAFLKTRPKLVITSWMGGESVESARLVFNRLGIPTFDTPERAVRAFMDLHHYAQNIEVLQEIPPKFHRRLEFDRGKARALVDSLIQESRSEMTEDESRILLSAYGISTEVRTNLPHHALKIGAVKDPNFGPALFFGTGGHLSEVMRDIAFTLPPINRHLAKICIQETRIGKFLDNSAFFSRASMELLEEILMRISQMVTDIEHIAMIDINPLVVEDAWVGAAKAKVTVTSSPVVSPMHLVISPYPNEFENTFYRDGYGELLVRPIRPEDAPLLRTLYESLSPRSIYMRFFTPLRNFQHSMLVRFTQVDYDREIALVAIQENEGNEKMLAVSRVIIDAGKRQAEFAVLVRDDCQGKGIGAELLSQCLSIARKRGIYRITGVVLAENTQMLTLGRKLGFKIARVPGSSEFELTIDFNEAERLTEKRKSNQEAV